MDNNEEYYTVQEIAEMLKVSANFVYDMLQIDLDHIRMGGESRSTVRVKKDEFDRWIESKTVRPKRQ